MTDPKLNRKLVLETPVQLPDGAGGYAEGWEALGTVWAGVRPGSGRLSDHAGLPVASLPLKITVRSAPQGSPARPMAGQRFRDGDRLYRIYSVTEADESARYLLCNAREEVTT